MIDYSPTFVKYLKKQENDKLLTKGSHIRHASPEGGTDTVGFGHKLTPAENAAGVVYGIPIDTMTPEQAEQVMLKDLDKKEQELTQTLGDRYVNLPQDRKEMLLDFAFNLGVTGTVTGFPKFTEAVLNDDMETAEKEHMRVYTPKGSSSPVPLARNKAFKETFLSKKTTTPKPTPKTISGSVSVPSNPKDKPSLKVKSQEATSFEKAFKKAKMAGKGTFKFRGRLYSTETKK